MCARTMPAPCIRKSEIFQTKRLPLSGELSPQVTEGLFSPSVKTFGFATSLIRGRLYFCFFCKLALNRQAQRKMLMIQYWAQNMGADTRFKRS